MRRRGPIRTILGLLLAILIGLPGDPASARPASVGQPGGVHHGRTHGKACKASVIDASADAPRAFIEEDGEADDDLDGRSQPAALLAELQDLPDLHVSGDFRPALAPSRSDGRACLRRSSRLRF